MDELAKVTRFAWTCDACKIGLHDRCWQHYGRLFGDPHRPCRCFPDCHDEHGELTNSALLDMMRRQPDVLLRRIKFREALDRGSLDLHLRTHRAVY